MMNSMLANQIANTVSSKLWGLSENMGAYQAYDAWVVGWYAPSDVDNLSRWNRIESFRYASDVSYKSTLEQRREWATRVEWYVGCHLIHHDIVSIMIVTSTNGSKHGVAHEVWINKDSSYYPEFIADTVL